MAEEFSPEEKLLRLIRGEKKKNDKPAAAKLESHGTSQGPRMNAFELPMGKVQAAKRKNAGRKNPFRFINSILIAALILTIAFFVFDILISKLSLFRPLAKTDYSIADKAYPVDKTQTAPTANSVSDTTQDRSNAEALPFSDYSEMVRRELFRPQKSEVEEKVMDEKKLLSGQERLNGIFLIGIISGEKPQAVIEDKKNQKTYFLYKGQSVNQLMITDILDDRVILDFEGEKLELVL